MKNALVLDSNDIKEILADKFNVSESDVIKSQYSFTVILPSEEKEETD